MAPLLRNRKRGFSLWLIGRSVAVKGSDRSGVRVRDDFRFFTPLRSVQNDREGALRSE